MDYVYTLGVCKVYNDYKDYGAPIKWGVSVYVQLGGVFLWSKLDLFFEKGTLAALTCEKTWIHCCVVLQKFYGEKKQT